jgi:hypothetical protein
MALFGSGSGHGRGRILVGNGNGNGNGNWGRQPPAPADLACPLQPASGYSSGR